MPRHQMKTLGIQMTPAKDENIIEDVDPATEYENMVGDKDDK